MRLSLPASPLATRRVYLFHRARWGDLNTAIAAVPWNPALVNLRGSQAAAFVTSTILGLAKQFIPQKVVRPKTAQSWVSERCVQLVEAKCAAEGTPEYARLQAGCSAGPCEEYTAHVRSLKAKASSLRSTKGWWWLASAMKMRSSSSLSTPPLQRRDGSWATTCRDKANLLAETFARKSE